METKKDYLEKVFFEARMQGLCKTQKEFADLLGMNQSTVSNALKGDEKYLTNSIVRRVQAWERQVLNGSVSNKAQAQAPAQDNRPDIVIPAATMDLYTSMAKSIDRLTALVERLQPGASAYSGAYTQKNPLADRK